MKPYPKISPGPHPPPPAGPIAHKLAPLERPAVRSGPAGSHSYGG